MKKNSRLLLVFTLIFVFANTQAQSVSRTPTILPQFSTALHTLQDIDGWFLASNGQWVMEPNAIPTGAGNPDDAIKIEIRTVTIEGKTYDALLHYSVEGSYRYPNLREGWSNYNQIEVCVLKDGEKERVNSYLNQVNVANRISIDCEFLVDTRKTIQELSEGIENIIDIKRAPRYKNLEVFPVMDGDDFLLRFRFREDIFAFTEFDPLIFDKGYLEVPFEKFSPLFANTTTQQVNPMTATMPAYCSTPANQSRSECSGAGN